jgi:chemotaxis protein MotA
LKDAGATVTTVSRHTIAGLLTGVVLLVLSVVLATDRYSIFLSVPSLLLVLGGTLANAFISYQYETVMEALRDIGRMFTQPRANRAEVADEGARVVEWARVVKTHGILELERQLKSTQAHDYVLHYGLQLVVDNHTPDGVRDLMGNTVESAYQRGSKPVHVLRNMAATAPAFGMVGTLVGLVIMLDGIANSPESLGPGLAVALLTTLYGVLLARLLFQPAADKTLEQQKMVRFRNYLMLEGFAMLAEGRMPRFVEKRMNSFLDPRNPIDVPRQAPDAPPTPTGQA